jgi:hypothetical protein
MVASIHSRISSAHNIFLNIILICYCRSRICEVASFISFSFLCSVVVRGLNSSIYPYCFCDAPHEYATFLLRLNIGVVLHRSRILIYNESFFGCMKPPPSRTFLQEIRLQNTRVEALHAYYLHLTIDHSPSRSKQLNSAVSDFLIARYSLHGIKTLREPLLGSRIRVATTRRQGFHRYLPGTVYYHSIVIMNEAK